MVISWRVFTQSQRCLGTSWLLLLRLLRLLRSLRPETWRLGSWISINSGRVLECVMAGAGNGRVITNDAV